MVDENKVMLMSRLAVLEKHSIKEDLKITSYYPEDYIYMNNVKTRLSILVVMIGLIGVQLLLKLEKGIYIPTNGSELLSYYIVPYGSVIIGVLIFYSWLSTCVYKKRYKEAEARVTRYKELLEQLDEWEEGALQERWGNNGKRSTYSIKDKKH
ncbi:MAG: hypothetical protein ACRCWY_13945 [Cellulosilyticaceae bacterium]